MEPNPDTSATDRRDGICAPCRFILWLSNPDRVMPRLTFRTFWHAGGWLLAPTLIGLLGSALLAPVAPVWSLVLLVGGVLGVTVLLWIGEHANANIPRVLQQRP